MIELCRGNMLEAQVEALVNTVNTDGVMGKGVALQFKQAFPEMFAEYRKLCLAGDIRIGRLHIYETRSLLGPRFIINFPTKKHWREKSQLDYIRAGMESLVAEIRNRSIRSLALPPLGCGMGGLSWKEVYPIIETGFAGLPELRVLVFPPQPGFKTERKHQPTTRPEMTLSRANVLSILKQYCVLGYELTLLEIHKLLYFLQEAGEPLRLRFIKEAYGPYAENLRFVLDRFEGHFTRGFRNGSSKPDLQIELLPEAIAESEALITKAGEENQASSLRVNRVAELIEGFESPYGMELLATVHWLNRQEKIADYEKIVAAAHAWNDRKEKLMKPEHIQIAWERLKEKGWIG